MIGHRFGNGGARRIDARHRAMAAAAARRIRQARAEAEGQSTFEVNFDYVETKTISVKASSMEEAVKKAWGKMGSEEVVEVWCNEKDGRNLSSKESYMDGGWCPLRRP